MNIKKSEYIEILKYYNVNLDDKKYKIKDLRSKVEEIVAKKICNCIKKVKDTYKNKVIGICENSVVNKKNLKINGFRCKKGAKLTGKKKLIKTCETLKLKLKNK
jgi:hypothetical protein